MPEDIDSDGDLDLVSLAESWLIILDNHGDSTFDVMATIDLGEDILSADLADLDGDLDPDIAAITESTEVNAGRLVVLWHDGEEGFTPGEARDFSPAPTYLQAADADADGDPDLLVSAKDQFLFFRRDGDADLSGPHILEMAVDRRLLHGPRPRRGRTSRSLEGEATDPRHDRRAAPGRRALLGRLQRQSHRGRVRARLQ